MKHLLLLLTLVLSIQAGSVVSIPSAASIIVSDGGFFCADEITVASGGTFTASSGSDVCVTPTGDGDISLPVVLSYFDARLDVNMRDIHISWETESEIENQGFILERLESEASNWLELASYLSHPELGGQGSVTHKTSYSYTDKSALPEKVYEFRISDVSYAGERVYHSALVSVMTPVNLPTTFVLEQNYPNPFNPSTTIRYGLPEESELHLIIYDVQGNLVHLLESGSKPAGWYDLTWSGQTISGEPISSGLYFARIEAGAYRDVIRMLYLK